MIHRHIIPVHAHDSSSYLWERGAQHVVHTPLRSNILCVPPIFLKVCMKKDWKVLQRSQQVILCARTLAACLFAPPPSIFFLLPELLDAGKMIQTTLYSIKEPDNVSLEP